jgi:hypothetical protein
MFRVLSARKSFVVTCKHCRRIVSTGVAEFPFQSIVVACTLCREPHRYRPSEIRRGRAEEYVALSPAARTHPTKWAPPEPGFLPLAGKDVLDRLQSYIARDV